jgi:hypothetical protein
MYWLRILRKITFYAASVGAVSFCAVAIIGLAKPGHASAAYSTDLNCTDASTEFNVVVVARVLDYQGNVKGYANNYSFHVNAFETNLAYKDYGPWNGTWKNTKQAGHDDYKRNAAGQYQWRDFEANWHYYDSRNVDYSTGDHPKFSNEAEDWIQYRSEAIRRWNNGNYTHDGKNHDFNVTMNGNYVNGALSGSGMATGKGNACQIGASMEPTYAFRDGDNTHHPTLPTVNGYGATAAWTNEHSVGAQALGHDGNNESWSLSCLGASDNGSINIQWMYFNFAITNQAIWDRSYVTNAQSWTSRQTALPGGTWTGPQDLRAINGSSTTVYFDYKEPPPAIVNPTVNLLGSMEEGTPVTAQGFINNATNSNGTADYTRQFWYESIGNNDSYDVGETLLGPGDASGSGGFGASGSYTIGDWGPVALDGIHTRVCTRLTLTGVSSPGLIDSTKNPATACRNIIRKPYFQVFNGDIDATGVFPDFVTGNACPTVGALSGGILAFNNGNPTYTGSGSNLAAFARGTIDQFITGNTHAANMPEYLSFANAGGYGGGFGLQHCMPSTVVDDFNLAKNGATGPVSISQPAVGTSTFTQYVKGDVYITSNITYAGAGYGSFSVSTIPRYKVVATGNIYIRNDVSQIDGVYEAGGKIYTCAVDPGGGSLIVTSTMDTACRAQRLTVNGALLAPEVKLLRSFGTVGLNNGAAETINFSPEVWLKELRDISGTTTTNTTTEYDAITNLPPVL